MGLEVHKYTIAKMGRKPDRVNRMYATIRVLLRETISSETFDHDLVVNVWTHTTDQMGPGDVQAVLMGKATAIIQRTVAAADSYLSR